MTVPKTACYDPPPFVVPNCMDLVCMYSRLNVYVCNPVLNKWLLLPNKSSWSEDYNFQSEFEYVAMDHVASTSEYKVVRIFYVKLLQHALMLFEILTLGDDHWRTDVEQGPPADDNSYFDIRYCQRVVADGAVYIMSHKIHLANIACFDMAREKWSSIPLPFDSGNVLLTNVGRQLGLVRRTGCSMEVWLREREEGEWVNKYCIGLVPSLRDARLVAMEEDGRGVILRMGHRLKHYDAVSGKHREICDRRGSTVTFYTESFKSLSLFGVQMHTAEAAAVVVEEEEEEKRETRNANFNRFALLDDSD